MIRVSVLKSKNSDSCFQISYKFKRNRQQHGIFPFGLPFLDKVQRSILNPESILPSAPDFTGLLKIQADIGEHASTIAPEGNFAPEVPLSKCLNI